MISFGRRFGIGTLLVVSFGCGSSLPSSSQTGGQDGGSQTGGHGGGSQTGGHGGGSQTGGQGGGSQTGGQGGGSACAASGASCAVSGCCQEIFETCISQAIDKLCLNAIPPPRDGGVCGGGASSNLSGVQLVFPDQPCSYTAAEVAAGIQIVYDEVITAPVGKLVPAPGDDGGCARPDDAGLIVGYRIAGAGQNYCLCDTGLCAPQSLVTTPVVGTHARQISWDGRNWNGPSDTGNREGAAFPPGTYTITLTASGTRQSSDSGADAGSTFSVTASRSITITP
jgi:hypothetical protein